MREKNEWLIEEQAPTNRIRMPTIYMSNTKPCLPSPYDPIGRIGVKPHNPLRSYWYIYGSVIIIVHVLDI